MSERSRIRRIVKDSSTKRLTPDESFNMITFMHLEGEENLENASCSSCQDYKKGYCQGRDLKGWLQVEVCMRAMVGHVTGSFQVGNNDKPEVMFMLHQNIEAHNHGHAFANTKEGEEIIRMACQEMKLYSEEV